MKWEHSLPRWLGSLCICWALAWRGAWAQEAPSLAAQLESAVNQGDAARVRALLEAGADPKSVFATNEPQGVTAVHNAISPDSVEVLRLLLDAGGSPDAPSGSTAQPPLLQAVYLQSLPALELLLRHGAKVDARDALGRTALLYAVEWHSPPFVDTRKQILPALIRAGADLDAKNADGVPPLLYLACRGQFDFFLELMHAGASLEKALAAKADAAEGKLRVCGSAGLDFLDDLRTQAPAHALGRALAWYGVSNEEAIAELLRLGADVNVESRHGVTPLMSAIAEPSADLVRRFLAAGADPNLVSSRGETPLMQAVRSFDPEVMRLLLEAKADPRLRGPAGRSALDVAVMEGHVDAARVLLGAGVDGNELGPDGLTALMLAVERNQPEAIRLLAASGADVNRQTPQGATALSIAVRDRRPELASALIGMGADVHVRLAGGMTLAMLAAGGSKPSDLDTLRVLLGAGAEVNAQDDAGATALAYAVLKAWDPAKPIQLLVEAGADVNLKNKAGASPLALAARRADPTLASYLRSLGARE